jgi:hypothetical protein
MQPMIQGSGSRRKRRFALIAALGAVVLVAGAGVSSAVAAAGGPGTGDEPSPAASSEGPTPITTPHDMPPEVAPLPVPSLGAIPVVRDGTPIAMPLDGVMTSLADIALLDKARELNSADCMHALGFTGWTSATLSGPADVKDRDVLDYLSPSDAAQSGYRVTFSDRSDGTHPATQGSGAPGSPDAVRAYLGGEARTAAGRAVPEGGCEAAGDAKLRGSTLDLPVDPRRLAAQAIAAAMRDSRMQAVFAGWSSCMAKRGLHYGTPLSAQNDPRWGRRIAVTVAGAEEKAVAAADAACQQETNLVGTYKALEIAYQQELLTPNQSKLAAAHTIFGRWVSNARSVIAVH